MKYTIDYEYETAKLYTPSEDWESRFYDLANQCFGIRKSIGKVELKLKEDAKPSYLVEGEYERLEHNGDVIVWNKEGEKVKAE
jgi:hypothetical protein